MAGISFEEHTTEASVIPIAEAKAAASHLIALWSPDSPFDAEMALDEHPELRLHKSVVLDLAYEEYCQRIDAGEDISSQRFVSRFKTVQKSLLHLLDADRVLKSHFGKTADLSPAEWPKADETYLDFHLVEELGRGAFSRVFLARETKLGNRQVVVKICAHGREEAQMLGKLQHPNIGPVLFVRNDDQFGTTVICMPFLSRATLFDVLDEVSSTDKLPSKGRVVLDAVQAINNGGVSRDSSKRASSKLETSSYVDGVVQIGVKLAEALVFTHEKGICHRDIKPSNVLVTSEGTPLLFDFNLSHLQGDGLTDVGGTIPYMAPEQLRMFSDRGQGERVAPDERSDLFSLGVTLYELLCGKLPFGTLPERAEPEELAKRALEAQREGPQPIRQNNPLVDPQLAAIVERCLSFDPQARPQSASEFLLALRRLLKRGHRVNRWIRTRKRRLAATAVAATVAMTCAVCALGALIHYKTDQMRLGWEANERGEHDVALTHFRQAYDTNPSSVDPQTKAYMGYLYARKSDFGRAAPLFDEAAREGFATSEVYNNAGLCYRELGRFDQGADSLERALEIDQKLAAAHYNLVDLEWQRALNEERVPDVTALKDALKKLGGYNGEFYLLSALTRGVRYTFSDDDLDPMNYRLGQTCSHAVREGIDPKFLDRVAELYPPVKQDGSFQRAREGLRQHKIVERAERLLHPLPSI